MHIFWMRFSLLSIGNFYLILKNLRGGSYIEINKIKMYIFNSNFQQFCITALIDLSMFVLKVT